MAFGEIFFPTKFKGFADLVLKVSYKHLSSHLGRKVSALGLFKLLYIWPIIYLLKSKFLSIPLFLSEILKFLIYGQSKVFAVQWIEVKYQDIDGNKSLLPIPSFSHCKYSKFYQSPEYLHITSTLSHLRKYIFLIITRGKHKLYRLWFPSTWKLYSTVERNIGFRATQIGIWILTLIHIDCVTMDKLFDLCKPFRIVERMKYH